VVTRRPPSESEMQAMRLGWKLVRFVKSNAVVFSTLDQLLGVGAGQMSRVDAVRLAGMKAAQAGLELQGAAMASDAFFPFPDGVEVAAEMGIKAVIQPGGSVRDEAVIAAADSNDMSMILTGSRHFRH
ncbi:MAG: bifunctional phosphoribosylaminoimidazolecarboxamide formyltransferase/IMP cyclohydrolase, partial [Candidatus Marinimicrobia bacterium]|nr:bifunctional phosphoribosylaminoimidazolecarboxamide formyltransferase/IMP cyclohydrolase [Candidatus Neomarinimicrobiota bacterium]